MKRILIVDDDVHIGNMLEEALAREGYSVSRAYSGTEAVMSVKLCKPDLVLLDLMLPGLSGEEVLPKLRGIPVIVMSAKASVDSKVELLLGGAADYVTKPLSLIHISPPALMRAQESSALCGARAGALPLHPAAFEKAGETFKRASRSDAGAAGGQFRSGGSESTTTASALVWSSFVRAVACSRDLFSQSSTPFMRT